MEETHEKYNKEKVRDYWEHKLDKPYGSSKHDIIFAFYLLLIFIWAIIIIWLSPSIDIYGWVILGIPLFLFMVAMLSLDDMAPVVEENAQNYNVLSAALLFTIPLLKFITSDFKGDRELMNESYPRCHNLCSTIYDRYLDS